MPESRNPDGNGDRRGDDSSDGIPVGALVSLALAGLMLAAVVVFVLQNLDRVPVNFLSWSFDAPLILLLAGAACTGVPVWWLVRFAAARRTR